MNNEIKEILDLKENADYKKLSCDEIKVLRDYITNLQEENERLELLNDELELYNIIKKAFEYIKEHQRKDEFLNLNEWQTRDLLNILNGRSDE